MLFHTEQGNARADLERQAGICLCIAGIGIFYQHLPEKATFGAKSEIRETIAPVKTIVATRCCDREWSITSARDSVSSSQDNVFVL